MIFMHRAQENAAKDFKFLISSHLKYNKLSNINMNRIYRLGQEMGFCNDEIEEILEESCAEASDAHLSIYN